VLRFAIASWLGEDERLALTVLCIANIEDRCFETIQVASVESRPFLLVTVGTQDEEPSLARRVS